MNTNLKYRLILAVPLLALAASLSACGRQEHKIDIDAFVDEKISILADSTFNLESRCRAVHALGNLGTLASRAVPILECVLDNEHPTVREAIVSALRQIDPSARPLAMARHEVRG
jgi:HEAT repeat protein